MRPEEPAPNRAPTARAGGPYTGVEGGALTLDGSSSSDPDGDPLTYHWSFGDGTTGSGGTPSKTYIDDGVYPIVLTVSDPDGASHQSSTTATIANAPPAVTLSLGGVTVSHGQTVTATGSFTDPGLADAPWAWEFDWGDGTRTGGSTSTQGSPITAQRAWAASGSYAVTFRVTDRSGGSGTAQQTVLVSAGAQVSWVWSGGQTASGAMVRTRLSGPASHVRLRVSTDSLFGTFTETAVAGTTGNDVATFMVSGLAPHTRYFYRPVVQGVEHASFQGAFRTLPVAGAPHSFSFALGSCQRTVLTSTVFNDIRAAAPLFWLQTGDIHYRNIAVNDIELFRHAYNALHDYAPQAALFRSTALVHVWDDHDGAGGNDTDGTKTGWPAVKAAYRENVPHHPLVEGAGGAIHHSFVVGRVRFIVSDLRSARSPKTHSDDASKTMFGAAQKAHFKAELAAAKAAGQFIAWVTSVPWIAAPTTGADHWGGYDTERREIAAYIEQLGVGSRMFALSGDMHGSAIDTGVNNAWGGFPIFHAAPLDQTASTKGGPYTHGPFTSSGAGQWGLVHVVDNGGTTIQVTFSGRRLSGQITNATHQFTLTL